jgi:hypothetical protein
MTDGYRVSVRVDVIHNTNSFPCPPALAHVERVTIISRDVAIDGSVEASLVGAAMADVIHAAVTDAREQLRELGAHAAETTREVLADATP